MKCCTRPVGLLCGGWEVGYSSKSQEWFPATCLYGNCCMREYDKMNRDASSPFTIRVSRTILAVGGTLYVFLSFGMISSGVFASENLLVAGMLLFLFGIVAIVLVNRLRSDNWISLTIAMIWAISAVCMHSINLLRIAESESNNAFVGIVLNAFFLIVFTPLPLCLFLPALRKRANGNSSKCVH